MLWVLQNCINKVAHSLFPARFLSLSLYLSIYLSQITHTHTHAYVYTYVPPSKTHFREGFGGKMSYSCGARTRHTLSETCSFRMYNWFSEARLRAWTL